jgi:membrane-associated phospholipid phosphatase
VKPADVPLAAARSRFGSEHPRAYLTAQGLLGFVLCAGSLWAFLGIADAVPEKGTMVRLDDWVAVWLQTHGSELGESIFSVVSWLGAPVLVAVLAIAFVRYARRREWLDAWALLVAAGGGTLINYALKMLFQRGRPDFASEFIHGTSWSFPSGHAMDSLVGYGFLVYLVLHGRPTTARGKALIAAIVVIVGVIGFSRVYLGVHYLSDVVGGYLAGAVWLLTCIAGYQFAGYRLRSR